jgi:3-phosphoshikimate 1-carboxyvinyltransferase
MKVSFNGGCLKGKVSPPPSKSHTHRAIFLASMAKGRSTISNALISEDTLATIRASEAMGAQFQHHNSNIIIDGGNLSAPSEIVDAMNSGTTMRIFSGLASMFDVPVRITGDESLQKRPMGPLLDALTQMGVKCSSNDGKPPVEIKGGNNGGTVHINGSISSQFITSLLLVSPMLSNDSEIVIDGKMVSEPYLDVTTSMMRRFGATAIKNEQKFNIKGNTGYIPYDYKVPADFSSAAFPLVAGALGGSVTVVGLDLEDPQGDRKIIEVLRDAGADISVKGDSITVEKGELCGMDLDIGDVPDLFPILAVLFSTANGTTRLYGAPQLKFKESDRIKTTVAMLTAIGADIEGTDDGCIIKGKKELLGGHINNEGDHRIMMAAAIASLICKNPVTMDNAECCSVSYPSFIKDIRSLGMKAEEY